MKIIEETNLTMNISAILDEAHSQVGIMITGIAVGDLFTYPKNISGYMIIYRYNPLPNPRIIIWRSIL